MLRNSFLWEQTGQFHFVEEAQRVTVRRGLTDPSAPELAMGLLHGVSALHSAAALELGHPTSPQLPLRALWTLVGLPPSGPAFLQNQGDHEYVFAQA